MITANQRETEKRIQFQSALIGNQWRSNVVIGISSDGWITSIDHSSESVAADEIYDAVALPGMPNVHSHAFQRGFAGLSEFRTAEQDSFWTWRKLMYDFLLKVTPEDTYVIARQLFLEMLLAGYTWVGEFHYVHNNIDGSRYDNLSELADAIVRAAGDTGIGLCMLPVLYQRGGFDDRELSGGQKRFELHGDEIQQIIENLSANDSEDFTCGIALHSLRAVGIESARDAIASVPNECPIHIHVAEQVQEIEECVQQHGMRSVEFLLDNFSVDENWCLIHATHLNEQELNAIAKSNAVVGLCPTTEANLGDGFFPAKEFLDANGRISIGSDSHCCVDFRDELRTLEYGQRLQRRQRAILSEPGATVGRTLYQQAARNGGQALGVRTGVCEIGYRADITIIDPNHPAIAGASGDQLIDRLIFCNSDDPVLGTIVGGKEFILDNMELQELVMESQNEFLKTCKKLTN